MNSCGWGEFQKVLRFVDEVPAKRAELAKEGKLSAKGLDEAVRARYASNVIPSLRRAAWEAEKTVADIATRRARLCHVEYDKTDFPAAFIRHESRARLCTMSQGEAIAAITTNVHYREAAFEGPAVLCGLDEATRSDIKRRIGLEEHPQEAAQLEEAEEAVAGATAAINMAVRAVQTSGGFEGNDSAFEGWMTASSAGVEREIAAEKSGAKPPMASIVHLGDELTSAIKKDIDRIFREGLPTIFKPVA